MFLVKVAGYAFLAIRKILDRCFSIMLKPLFKASGTHFRFDPWGVYSFSTISVGDDVYIGPGACLSAKKGITIGDKVLFGPHVTIMGGDHNISKIGQYIADVREKRPEDDKPVVIEDDVWVGAGVIILKGVTIGRGAVVGAGAVVTEDIPRYAVAAGVPARVVRMRWGREEIALHERILYQTELSS